MARTAMRSGPLAISSASATTRSISARLKGPGDDTRPCVCADLAAVHRAALVCDAHEARGRHRTSGGQRVVPGHHRAHDDPRHCPPPAFPGGTMMTIAEVTRLAAAGKMEMRSATY